MIRRVIKACVMWIFGSILWTLILQVLSVSDDAAILLAVGGGAIIGLVSALIIIK